jgi:hypothetical protein
MGCYFIHLAQSESTQSSFFHVRKVRKIIVLNRIKGPSRKSNVYKVCLSTVMANLSFSVC